MSSDPPPPILSDPNGGLKRSALHAFYGSLWWAAIVLGSVWWVTRSLYDADLRPGDALVFGRESAGLPAEILEAHPDRCVTIPMLPGERSLNLSCTVVAALSEAMRQALARGDRTLDPAGRLAPGG